MMPDRNCDFHADSQSLSLYSSNTFYGLFFPVKGLYDVMSRIHFLYMPVYISQIFLLILEVALRLGYHQA